MKSNFLRGWFILLALGVCSIASGNTYSVTVMEDITQLNQSTLPENSKVRDFELGQRVYVVATMRVQQKKMQPSTMRIKWYRCGDLVRERSLPLVLQNAPKNTAYRHHVWFWMKSDMFGPGQFHADVYADNVRVGRTAFSVKPYRGPQVLCEARVQAQKQAFDTVYFKPGRFNAQSSYLKFNQGGADELVHSIFKRYTMVRNIEIVAYSDVLESKRLGTDVSAKRAAAIKSILLARGFHANKMTTTLKRSAHSSSECSSNVSIRQNAPCLAEQRRVELKIDGILK